MVFVDGRVGWRAGRARWVGLVAKRRIRGGLLASTFFFGVEEGGSSSSSSSSSSFFLFGAGFILRLRSHNISATQPDGCHRFDDQGKDLIVFVSFSGETRYSRSPRYAPSRSKYRSDPSYLRSALTNFFIHTLTFCIGSCRLRDFLPSGPQIVSIVIYVGLFFTGTAEKSTSPVEEGCPWNANIFGANTQRS
jgi:hypothetical protein